MGRTAKQKREARAAAKAAGESGFRLQRHKVGLTYSCPVDAEQNPISSREQIRDVLVERYGQAIWTISVELHENGKNHYHANFKFDNKLDVLDSHCMDIEGVHPNIINPGKGWENYVRKQGEFITNMSSCPFAEATAMESVHSALQHLWQQRPQDMCKHGESIERNLRKHFAPVVVYQPYNGPYEHWIDWEHTKMSLLIWGPPGGGKTQYARWLMAHKFGAYTYVKKSHEELKKVSFEHAILF